LTDNDHNELEKLILVQCPGIIFNRNPFRSLRQKHSDGLAEEKTNCLSHYPHQRYTRDTRSDNLIAGMVAACPWRVESSSCTQACLDLFQLAFT
jgi:hypothetical protein